LEEASFHPSTLKVLDIVLGSSSVSIIERQSFVLFKARLKERFQQIDIWMTTYPIDVL